MKGRQETSGPVGRGPAADAGHAELDDAERRRWRDHAALDTWVAWVHDLFERIVVDGREKRAGAVWKAPTNRGVARLGSASSWLRRSGAGRLLIARSVRETIVSLPRPLRGRSSGERPPMACLRCGITLLRSSGAQRYCSACSGELRHERRRAAVARRRSR